MLNQADVDRAKRELRSRRTEILKRHADELRKLDAEQTEIETLEKMVQAFAQKFAVNADVTTAVAEASQQQMLATDVVPGVSPTSPACSSPQRKYQATNFELFSRAFSTSTF